jgi:CheY-like chemotaxis protein
MNGVIGMTELLLETSLSTEQRSLATSIGQSGEHLLDVIKDILDFSKVEADRLELESIRFDPKNIIEAAVELMAPAAHSRDLELVLDVGEQLPERVIGDPSRFRQILLNLIGNAVKFTQTGEIVVCVSAEPAVDGRVLIRIEVKDTGIGISAAAMPNLFTAFSQADSSTMRRFGGTGLGLAIARRLANLMGGEIEVESEEGKGATFRFTASFPVDRPPREPRAILAGSSILIVDRNPSSKAVLERYAHGWGMAANCVGETAQALEALESRQATGVPFDVVLTDDPAMVGGGAALLLMLTRSGPRSGRAMATPRVFKPVKRDSLLAALCSILKRGPYQGEPSWPEPPGEVCRPSRGRILIAEDNPVNQRVARLQVKRLGFEVDVVSDGREVLDALGNQSYAMVLMDCQMPGLDGWAATRELRRRENCRGHIPVIAMTAHAYATDRERCIEAGMDDYLSKPVSLRSLGAVLDRWAGIAAGTGKEAHVQNPTLS